MEERFRLVFRGEVLAGQHRAVVRKRLGEALRLDDDRLTTMFSGKAVTLKRAASPKEAARFQAAFKKAGARLRVLPVDDTSTPSVTPEPSDSSATRGPVPESTEPERADASDPLTLAAPGATIGRTELPPEPDAPDVSHITIAQLGAMLGDPSRHTFMEVDIDPAWELAELGSDLGAIRHAVHPVIDVEKVNFSIAEPGVVLDERPRKAPPPAPDTSHITLVD